MRSGLAAARSALVPGQPGAEPVRLARGAVSSESARRPGTAAVRALGAGGRPGRPRLERPPCDGSAPSPPASRCPTTWPAGARGSGPRGAGLGRRRAGATRRRASRGGRHRAVHNFSLIHDDIIDGDRERRHRPTVWAAFGIGPAIIAGDALATLATEVLLEEPTAARVAAAAALDQATQAHDRRPGRRHGLRDPRRRSRSRSAWPWRRARPGPCSPARPPSGAILGRGPGRRRRAPS